jgi:hypothetical protein
MVEVKRYKIKVIPLIKVKNGSYENIEAIINHIINTSNETKKIDFRRFFKADFREINNIANKIRVVIPKEPSSLPNFTIIPSGVNKE